MPTIEDTLLDAILAAARTCTLVQGVDDGRRTAYQPDTEPMPRINMILGNSDARLEIGADVCIHSTQVHFEIIIQADDVPGTSETAGSQPATRKLADPIRAQLHAALFAAFPFAPEVRGFRFESTERPEPGDEDGIYVEKLSYSIQFETRETDLTQAP